MGKAAIGIVKQQTFNVNRMKIAFFIMVPLVKGVSCQRTPGAAGCLRFRPRLNELPLRAMHNRQRHRSTKQAQHKKNKMSAVLALILPF
jgi:hypothetical protein